ncbi:uncharacterized protein YmfQ (DUF2313 family) [Paraburkholderia eburnea]|uniref:Uncharacterized protein YmfQ (DUF2313 family) n=2 Tax=Paraburkholderia eburnea TaxID=1189126 RepID=A0A2S4ME96_9BURK|nr:uncharacterized protein YmfQ (DUF2313 family) [Paraburkholderia eburnea]PRZ23615.1 uncharacterized protein YmfQ (DUF2313 family) [Paraburkholderia eburnea]
MPRGRVWPKDPDAVQTQALQGHATPFQKHNDRANYLLVDAFPATTNELLPEWEATLGLPDPCAGTQPSLATRQAQVLARFAGVGGQSMSYFIGYAAKLGYTVSIRQHQPFRMGQSRMGDALGGSEWAFVWDIVAPASTVTRFTMGQSAMGDPLASWGNAVLECEIGAYAPAHTLVRFIYGATGELDSDFILDQSVLY